MLIENKNNKAVIIYNKIVDSSREDFFSKKLFIDDDFRGRYEVLCLNISLILWYFKHSKSPEDISQDLIDIFFEDIDGCLRELGVSDLSVGRRIKILAENFYGRLSSYSEAIDSYRKEKKINKLISKIENNIDSFNISKIHHRNLKLFKNYLARNIEFLSEFEFNQQNIRNLKLKKIQE